MNRAYIALGTNIEPRKEYLTQAIERIKNNKDLNIKQQSSIYETTPVGYTEQPDFLNMVLEIDTPLSSLELLETCQSVEIELGRKREIRFGPRTIDLDILLYNEEVISMEHLIVPHPRMHERAFVLIPLIEIAPELNIPYWNKTVNELLNELTQDNKKGVEKWIENELGEE